MYSWRVTKYDPINSLSSYTLITDTYEIMPYTLMLLGIMVLFMGVSELKEKRKASAIILFLVAGFDLFVVCYTWLS